MDILNLPNCGGVTSTFNTGVNLCDIIKDIPFGLLLTDSGYEISAAERADLETFVDTIKDGTRASRGARVYPLWDLVNFEDTTKEAQRGTVGNLSITDIKLIDAVPGFKFGHYKGELFHAKLSKAERERLRIFIVDQNYAVYGTKKSSGAMAGFSLNEFSVDPSKFATPQGAAQYPFNVVLASLLEYKDNLAFVQADSTLGNISGLVDVNLEQFNLASNVVKVSVKADGDQQNLFDLYATELAAAGACQSTSMLALSMLLLRSSDQRFRGRIMGVRMLAIYPLPLGMLIAGALIPVMGYHVTATLMVLSGLAMTAAVALAWRQELLPLEATANGR